MNRSNIIVGIFLILMLGVLATENILPNLASRFFPGVYRGIPCAWLKTGTERDFHQSILGRSAGPGALTVEVVTSQLATDPSDTLTVRIVLVNNTIAPLAIVYNEDQVIIGDNGTSGAGLQFQPPVSIPLGTGRSQLSTFPESDIRILAPKQRCVHTVDIPAGNLLGNPSFTSGQASVTAFYRSNTPGVVVPQPGPTPIYTDQGLWTGFAQSAPEAIPIIGP